MVAEHWAVCTATSPCSFWSIFKRNMSIQVEDGSRNAKYVEDWLAGVTRGEQHSHTNPRTPLER